MRGIWAQIPLHFVFLLLSRCRGGCRSRRRARYPLITSASGESEWQRSSSRSFICCSQACLCVSVAGFSVAWSHESGHRSTCSVSLFPPSVQCVTVCYLQSLTIALYSLSLSILTQALVINGQATPLALLQASVVISSVNISRKRP